MCVYYSYIIVPTIYKNIYLLQYHPDFTHIFVRHITVITETIIYNTGYNLIT